MKIGDLEDFKLSDNLKFHDRLNPLIFTDDKLQPDVRDQLMVIAHDFVDFMGIKSLKVVDVRLYGSNVAYTYTQYSDIDLHILVDMSDIQDDEVYLELFNAKKRLYNDEYKITVRGLPVELYMQSSDDVVQSLGEYSVLNDRWVKFPQKSKATISDHSVKAKFKRLVALAELALRSDDLSKVDEVIAMVRRYRRAGLAHGGEFSPENISFKILRNKGITDKLYKHQSDLKSNDLSIDEDVYENMNLDDNSKKIFEEYTKFIKTKEFDFSDAPDYNSFMSDENVRRNYNQKILKFVWESRGNISAESVFRDLNEKWQVKKTLKESKDISDVRSLLDKCFHDLNVSDLAPGKIVDIFEMSIPTNDLVQFSLHENVKIKHVQVEQNGKVMIMDSKDDIFIQGYFEHQHIENRFVNKGDGQKGLFLMGLHADNVNSNGMSYKGWRIASSKESFADRMNRQFKESKKMLGDLIDDSVESRLMSELKQFMEASGYIPSKAEKDDPRFKTALSVDVDPDIMPRQAKVMGLGSIKRDGRPQQLKPSGKFTR
jgi:predicted nucleotidyltransferase